LATLALAITATLYLFVSIVFAGKRKPGYDHLRHTISELAEHGSRYTKQVSYGVFLPVAIALGLIACFVRPSHPPIATLALSIAIGYGLGAMFPCDHGSPATGSARQGIHNLGGGIEYIGGALSLLWIGESGWLGFQFAGVLVGVSAFLLVFESRVRGIIQRVAELCLFLGLVSALWIG